MSLRASVRSFVKADAFCAVLLCLLAPLPYLPAAIFHLSLDPINFGSGLVNQIHRGVTLGGPWLDPNTSFTIQALGGLSAHDWLHGVVPWWNPYTGVGIPLAAEMQTISFFLPFVLLLHFPSGVIFLKISLQIIAGLATYALLRQLGLGRLAAFAGAVFYEFNGPFAWFAHGPIMPIAFLPLLLLGIERAFARAEDGRRGGWVVLGVAFAYSLYAGFPETAFLDGLLALVWAVYRLVVARPSARLSFAIKVAAGGVGGLLLAAPIIVPFLEYQGLSGIGHSFPTDGLPKISLAPLLMPYIFGPIGAFNDADPSHRLGSFWGANGGYLNLTLLFLALIGLFSGKRQRGMRIVLAIWVALFLGRVMNVFHLGHLFSLLPFMNVIAIDRYCEPAWTMAAAILAAFALDDWRRAESRRLVAVLISGIASLVIGVTAVRLASGVINALLHNLHGKHYAMWLWGSLGWATLFTIAIAWIYLRGPMRHCSVVLGGLIAVNVICLFSLPPLAGVRAGKPDIGLVTFLQQHAGLERFYTLGPFSPNYGAYYRVASINHNAVPIPADWIRYIDSTLDPHSVTYTSSLFIGYFPGPFSDRENAVRTHLTDFEATGVKYVLAQPGTNPFNNMVTESESDKPKRVYHGQVADVFELPHFRSYFEAQGGPCQVSSNSRRFVHAVCEAPAVLIRRELLYPGWHVSVNGRESQLMRSGSIFQMVRLPGGKSEVLFSYQPSHVGWAYLAAIVGFIVLLIGATRASVPFIKKLSLSAGSRTHESYSAA